MHVTVTDQYILACAILTMSSLSHLKSTCLAKAGIFDAGPSVGLYSPISLRTNTSHMKLTWPRQSLLHSFAILLPTYSVRGPLCLHVDAFPSSCWVFSIKYDGLDIMTSSSHATWTISPSFSQAKDKYGLAFDWQYIIFWIPALNVLKKQWADSLILYKGIVIFSTTFPGYHCLAIQDFNVKLLSLLKSSFKRCTFNTNYDWNPCGLHTQ